MRDEEGRVEVTFLGVGAAVPAPGGTNCSYLVRAAGAVLLIDCGPAVLQQLAAVGVTPGDVTHLLLTHRHGDHILGYPMFLLRCLPWPSPRWSFRKGSLSVRP
jgi:ribonuclease Z